MHATSDGAFTEVEPFASVLERADAAMEPGAPFHVHFSDIASGRPARDASGASAGRWTEQAKARVVLVEPAE